MKYSQKNYICSMTYCFVKYISKFVNQFFYYSLMEYWEYNMYTVDIGKEYLYSVSISTYYIHWFVKFFLLISTVCKKINEFKMVIKINEAYRCTYINCFLYITLYIPSSFSSLRLACKFFFSLITASCCFPIVWIFCVVAKTSE